MQEVPVLSLDQMRVLLGEGYEVSDERLSEFRQQLYSIAQLALEAAFRSATELKPNEQLDE